MRSLSTTVKFSTTRYFSFSTTAFAKREAGAKYPPTPYRFGLFISHALGKYFAKLAITTNSIQNRGSVDNPFGTGFGNLSNALSSSPSAVCPKTKSAGPGCSKVA